jgi:small subunit ribosomal protein S2
MKELTLEELFTAGVHVGHHKSHTHPGMRPFIFTIRNNIGIFNLEKTREALMQAYNFLRSVRARSGVILFVCTKEQTKAVVEEVARSCGMPYVTTRWLGGTLTNFETVKKSMRRLNSLEQLVSSGEIERYTKKEQLTITREIKKMHTMFAGIRDMHELPDALVVFDVQHDAIAVREAQRKHIPIVGVCDANVNPKGIDYVIPANDDAVRGATLIAKLLASAVQEGQKEMAQAAAASTPEASAAAIPAAEEARA